MPAMYNIKSLKAMYLTQGPEKTTHKNVFTVEDWLL